MPNVIRLSVLILYCSAIARLTVWLRTGFWPSFTLETFLAYPPPSSFQAVNVVFSVLWDIPIEFWFLAPVTLVLGLGAGNRDNRRSSPV